MPLTPNFTATQPLGEESVVTITDTSSGSDSDITQRRVYLRQDNGEFLVPEGTDTEYIEWPYADASIDVDALDKDYALVVIVQWLDVDNVVLYAKESLNGFTQYNESFDYNLTQNLSGNPLLINDNDFYVNKSDLRTNIDSGNQAIEQASDIYGAQQCYNAATAIRLNSPYSFNANS